MSALDALRWQNFVDPSNELVSTEGKQGVPRYGGEPSVLLEYTYRVRLREAREQTMDSSELKKLGPLGLRLVDGLSGTALQIVRGIPVEDLAKSDGPSTIIKHLQKILKPRRQQECRELYNAGARSHGILSRQYGEPMASFILRRKTWYSMLLDLDEKMKLPDGILAEQILMTAGVTEDHKLLIRTAIQGDVTVDKVCNELVAQHARIHEDELRRRADRFKGSPGKGRGRFSPRRPTWNANYVDADDDHNDGSEHGSQSLGGYDDLASSTAYNTVEGDVDEDDDVVSTVYEAMMADGFDDTNEEALEYATDILQIEAEAHLAHQRAKGSGHYGFGRDKKNFGYKGYGKMSDEEKKAKIAELKRKSSCRACGQIGHWSTDPVCPKGGGKKGKKGGKSDFRSSSASTMHGKGKGCPGPVKQRTVYFTVNEYHNEDEDMHGTKVVSEENAVFADEKVFESKAYMFNAVPPPSSLQHGEIVMTAEEMLDQALRQAQQGHPRQVPPLPLGSGHVVAHSNIPVDISGEDGDQEFDVVSDLGSHLGAHAIVPLSSTITTAHHGNPVSSTSSVDQDFPHDVPPGAAACPHLNVTRRGSNAYLRLTTCKDCGFVMERVKVLERKKMNTLEPFRMSSQLKGLSWHYGHNMAMEMSRLRASRVGSQECR